MKETRRLRIYLETHEIRTVRLSRNSRAFCRSCGDETLAISISEAASILQTSEPTVWSALGGDQIHAIEKGCSMICGNSISAFGKKTCSNREQGET